MDYVKLDAGLSAALEDEGDEESALTVFIHTSRPPGRAEKAILKRFGVRGIEAEQKVFTASLSPRAIEELSEHHWVKLLRLSRKSRLLGET